MIKKRILLLCSLLNFSWGVMKPFISFFNIIIGGSIIEFKEVRCWSVFSQYPKFIVRGVGLFPSKKQIYESHNYPLCLQYYMPLTSVFFFIFDMSPRWNYNLLLKAIKSLTFYTVDSRIFQSLCLYSTCHLCQTIIKISLYNFYKTAQNPNIHLHICLIIFSGPLAEKWWTT